MGLWMVHSNVIEKLSSAVVKMVSKREGGGNSHQCLRLLLLWTVEEGTLVAADHDWVGVRS